MSLGPDGCTGARAREVGGGGISTCLQTPQSSSARLAREYRGHPAVYAGFAVKQGAHTRMQAPPANRSAHRAW